MKTPKSTKIELLLLVTATFVTQLIHAQPLNWTGLAGGGNLNWNNALNWSPNAVPTNVNSLVFDNVNGFTNAPGLVNNVLDASYTVSSISITAQTNDLTFVNNFHTTAIGTGRTLTISNITGTLLSTDTGLDDGANAQVMPTFTNGGNLIVGDINSPVSATSVQIGQRSGTSGTHRGTLDLSGLDNFTAGVGNFYVGGNGVSPLNRDQGTLILAGTNVIRALTQLRMAHSPGNQGSGSFLYLGQENYIYTADLRAGRSRAGSAGGVVTFRPGLVSRPTLKLRAADMTSRMGNLGIGDNTDGSGTTASNGSIDLTGGTLDAMVATMVVGRNAVTTTITGSSTATFSYDDGTLDVSTLSLGGQNTSGGNSTANVNGTLNVSGTASLIVGTLNIGRDAGTATGIGNGKLNVTSTGTISVTGNVLENNATGGNGSSTISVTNSTMTVAGNITVDTLNLAGSTLTVGGVTTLDSLVATNAILKLTLGPTSNPNTPLCSVTNLTVSAPVTLNVVGGGFALGQYPVIRYYSGTVGGEGIGAITFGFLPSGARGYFSNNIAGNSIDLVITNFSAVKWNGNVAGGDWDINTTANWIDTGSGLPTTYLQNLIPGDTTIFDDTASGTTTINLTTIVSPSVMTMTNSVKAYAFGGPGALSGPSGFTKYGSAPLVITNAGVNTFAGAVTVNGGLVQLGLAANRLPVNANVTLADASDVGLDLGNMDQTIGTLSGGGLIGGNVNLGAGNLTATAGATYAGVISGTGKFRKTTSGTQTLLNAGTYSGGTYLNGGAITVLNTNGSGLGTGPIDIVSGTLNVGGGTDGGLIANVNITNGGALVFNTPLDLSIGSIFGGAGTVTKNNTNAVIINGPGSYTGATTISDGALRINDATGLGSINGATSIGNPALARLELQGNITVFENFTLSQKSGASGQVPHFVNLSGTNTLSGSIAGGSGGSYWSFRSDAGKLIVNGTFSHTPTGNRRLRLFGAGEGDWATDYPAGSATARVTMEGPGTWTLSAVNTYNSDTELYGGTLIVNGQIQSAGNVIVGDPSTNTPARLGGTGIISSTVMVNTNGTIAPGDSIGTLTINNALILTGTAEMEVSPSSSDKVVGLTAITLGGTLKIVVSGTLTGTEVFKLFDAPAGTYSGDFSVYDLPALPSPLVWDYSSMPVDGTLRMATAVARPQVASFGRAGDGNFQLAGTGPTNAAYRILATTNVSLALTNWLEIGNGTFTGGAFSFTDVNATNHSMRFYSVATP